MGMALAFGRGFAYPLIRRSAVRALVKDRRLMPDRLSIAIFFAFPLAMAAAAGIVASCGGAEGGGLLCVRIQAADLTDGDSARLGGRSYRLTGAKTPINAPETRAGAAGRAGATVTRREAEWGAKALEHGRSLLAQGGALCPTGKDGGFGRPAAVIRLPDGRDYGAAMVEAGLATPTERREHDHWNAKEP